MTRTERFTQAFRIETMSAKTLARLIIGGVALAGSLGAAGRWINSHPTKAEVDSSYVHKYDFALYQQGMATLHMRDSLIQDARDVRRDSLLSSLYRACHRRGECP
jgi:hypothetical protein